MAVTAAPDRARPIHPLLAFFLAGAAPLFLGALLSDLAYGSSAEPQWSNFAAWLLVGAMVLTGFALLGAVITLVRRRPLGGWPLLCFLLLLAAFVFGFIDSFVHSRDAWGIMPAAPIFSAVTTLAALAAALVGFSRLRGGEVR